MSLLQKTCHLLQPLTGVCQLVQPQTVMHSRAMQLQSGLLVEGRAHLSRDLHNCLTKSVPLLGKASCGARCRVMCTVQ